MQRVSERVASLTESATISITSRAAELRAAGVDVIGFGAGQPDFPTPSHIVAAAAEACREPRFHGYTPVAGLHELRQAISEHTTASGHEIDPSQVLVTNGAKHALFNALVVLLDPGDEVLLPSPYWVTYPEAIHIAGGMPVTVEPEDDFKVSVGQLERASSPRTKVLLFASPHNPTGAVYEPGQVTAIGEWAADRGIWVISDEIYDHLVYEPLTHASVATSAPAVRDRLITISGASKTYAMTGWRVGWLVGPADVVSASVSVQSHTTSNVNNVAQAAALAALRGDQSTVEEMRVAFDRRRRRMIVGLAKIPGVTGPEPQGAFYAFPSFEAHLGKKLGSYHPTTTIELAEALLEGAKVAVVPGEPFGRPGHLRFSYALSDDDLEEGLERVATALG